MKIHNTIIITTFTTQQCDDDEEQYMRLLTIILLIAEVRTHRHYLTALLRFSSFLFVLFIYFIFIIIINTTNSSSLYLLTCVLLPTLLCTETFVRHVPHAFKRKCKVATALCQLFLRLNRQRKLHFSCVVNNTTPSF